MFEVQILIPVADNDGNSFSPSHFGAFEAKASELFGGITRNPGTAQGSWVDEGTTYHDDSRVYAVAVKTLADGAKVAELVEFAKLHFKQLAIFIRYLGMVEIL